MQSRGKAFIATLLLITWMTKQPGFADKQIDVVEIFAGTGRISRLAAAAGWYTLVHDINFDRAARYRPGNNAMDLCSSAGYVPLACVFT